jgi:hypothetical protein
MKKKVKGITQDIPLINCLVDNFRYGPGLQGRQMPLSFDQRLKELKDYLEGWLGYFRYANMQNKLKGLDVWIRCRLRYCIWKHWRAERKENIRWIFLANGPACRVGKQAHAQLYQHGHP